MHHHTLKRSMFFLVHLTFGAASPHCLQPISNPSKNSQPILTHEIVSEIPNTLQFLKDFGQF